jgi:hypothetical protein
MYRVDEQRQLPIVGSLCTIQTNDTISLDSLPLIDHCLMIKADIGLFEFDLGTDEVVILSAYDAYYDYSFQMDDDER